MYSPDGKQACGGNAIYTTSWQIRLFKKRRKIHPLTWLSEKSKHIRNVIFKTNNNNMD